MARSSYQKLKPLYVMDYLLKNSDAEHPVTTAQLIDYLNSIGISAERKSIYDDIESLKVYGIDIIPTAEGGRKAGYYVGEREFELPELKLLVDSVQSSKFITKKKTETLIRKIDKLANIYDAQKLSRQVYVANRIKTMNESIYYNVDEIHSGIMQNRKIRFKYYEYTVSKEKRFKKGGAFYVVSPYALTWDDENYYLVSYDSEQGIIKHFRVDKMSAISVMDEERDGREAYDALDMAVYARKVFGMFSGEEKNVQLRFTNKLAGAVIDRLGSDVMMIPDGDEHFTVRTNVAVSPQFFAWVCGFADEAQIIAPDDVVLKMKEHIKKIYAMY